ncbi:TNFAIP3-interacting protein 1 isoform X1 [Monodelphis domestica]|uniref:TNFAIP3-interacting protein 1 isoform X1 n=2 Tax=Monodelphis domestica TaxID=13616 RepID=UPI0024E1B47F|nr:TNFAIP3-interacting protein 1 isoform X1 [Monodelphis domestica]
MEGRGPYRIYDPGGEGKQGEASAAFEHLVEENSRLKEKMQGIKTLGELLEESQMEASKLRQKVEELAKDNELLQPSPPSSSFDHLAELSGGNTNLELPPVNPAGSRNEQAPTVQKTPSSGASSEFEVVSPEEHKSPSGGRGNSDMLDLTPLPKEDSNLMLHLQRLESTLSVCAEEPDHTQVFTHLGRMALEFNRLASKVHKNEQRTSILQTLCEQLRNENEALKAKLEKDLEQRDQATEKLRQENLELKKLVMSGSGKEGATGLPGGLRMEVSGRKSLARQQQAGMSPGNIPEAGTMGATEKKVKILEQQRSELLEVNKQWDQHFRSMKQQYEQKITELRQKLADSQKLVSELESDREQKQRDFDRKLLLAKSKIEMEEADKERLTAEGKDLRQRAKYLQDQLTPLTRQREYQEKEIQRLNKALEEALNIQASSPTAFGSPEGPGGLLQKQELLTQNELLKQQVKIFEEDFQRERSDRERMNEEKEELKKQLEKLQAQVTLSNAQLKAFKEEEKAKEALRQQKRKMKASGERYHMDPLPEHICGAYPFACQPVTPLLHHHGFEDWSEIRYPPPPMATEHQPPIPNSRLFHLPEYAWRSPCGVMRNQSSQVDAALVQPSDPEPTDHGLPKN